MFLGFAEDMNVKRETHPKTVDLFVLVLRKLWLKALTNSTLLADTSVGELCHFPHAMT